MPGNRAFGGQGVESVSDLPGVTGKPGQRGDLTICRHSSLRDPLYHLIDALVCHGASGATLHSGGEQDDAGHDGDTTGPGWYGALLFH